MKEYPPIEGIDIKLTLESMLKAVEEGKIQFDKDGYINLMDTYK